MRMTITATAAAAAACAAAAASCRCYCCCCCCRRFCLFWPIQNSSLEFDSGERERHLLYNKAQKDGMDAHKRASLHPIHTEINVRNVQPWNNKIATGE